jgi:hypothetical protein
MNDMASVSCPHCSQSLDVPDSAENQTVRCPKCQHTFRTGQSSAVASGEPPVGAAGDAAVTDKPPSPKPTTYADPSDSPVPSIRRERASGGASTAVIVILVLAGMAVLGLCLCAPVVFFLGLVPVRMQAQQAQALAVEDAKVAQAEAVKPKLIGAEKGAADARDAIMRGKLLLKEWPPLPAPAWHGEYINLLKEKCNCDYIVIGEPNLPNEKIAEINGWNESMRAELQRRHGANILGELNQEAEKRWRDRIKK